MQPASELLVLMIILFLIGFAILIGSYFIDNILDPVQDKLKNTKAKSVISDVKGVKNTFDSIFLFIAVGSGIVSLLLAYLTPARPAFLFLAIIMFGISLVIIPQFANIFQDFTEKSQFSSYTSDYPMMMQIFKVFPTFLWVFGFLILVVLFAKIRGGQGEI